MRLIIISIISTWFLFTNVSADHEADHRYNIRGYILNANQQGLENLSVQAFSKGELLESGKTDGDGFYSLHLHLHDEDYKRVLKLRAGRHEADIHVSFDRSDSTSARIHNANFIDGKLDESELSRFHIPSWSYAVGGLILLIMTAVFLEKRRKKKRRLAIASHSQKHHPVKHKPKKSKRKKH